MPFIMLNHQIMPRQKCKASVHFSYPDTEIGTTFMFLKAIFKNFFPWNKNVLEIMPKKKKGISNSTFFQNIHLKIFF